MYCKFEGRMYCKFEGRMYCKFEGKMYCKFEGRMYRKFEVHRVCNKKKSYRALAQKKNLNVWNIQRTMKGVKISFKSWSYLIFGFVTTCSFHNF
jgi:hypothetical protein